ncbi:MAG TPA: NAD(P)/FAD-dependent oxidoreductase [Thermodesulfobacteriota bacterium]|nr:NAD(P)/FAD-dependent oxidoreductase [Thermodesulfobacteriota bacterium]HNU71739.1 NAD(P)/FAD-dependent oxidoreductase [Thermodesulfobacteriota bacterium]HOC38637.1 NAD(P)/FAD-dependent oxidoreductase [Thermodesulfobacteriota bacterium]HQO78209.1 NAD(P)/FAD-dependent oxidoreductase [Thermodesulfobacteriota bacterium]
MYPSFHQHRVTLMGTTSVLIIGGGASGMIAAIVAARHNAEVTVLERLDRAGRKILATGNGRCNLTNMHCDVSHYHGRSPAFAASALDHFKPTDTLAFFDDLGLLCREEDGRRVFPISGQASAVLDVLRFELDRCRVRMVCGSRVKRIEPDRNGFSVQTQDGTTLSGNRVIIATGGKAAPNLGSNGSGYHLAEELGHHCVEPVPSLVQLNLPLPFLKQMDGVKVNGSVSLNDGERDLRTEQGELLFTSYGISGIPVLQVSRIASERLSVGEPTFLDIQLFQGLSFEKIVSIIEKRMLDRPDLALDAGLIGFFHKRLIIPILHAAEIRPPRKLCKELTVEELNRLALILHRWRVPVIGTQSWMRAQVTAGGIDTAEINPEAMESILVPGLHFAGEIIDIDGDSGGYNLQWAWSSGYAAGLHAARR